MTLVDFRGNIVLDTYVSPTMPVSDYRTSVTGISAEHLDPGKCLSGFVTWVRVFGSQLCLFVVSSLATEATARPFPVVRVISSRLRMLNQDSGDSNPPAASESAQ